MRPIVRSWLPWLLPALLILVPLVVPAQDSSPLSAEEEISLTEIRDFVAATAQRYRMVAPLQVSVAPWVGNPSLSQYAGSPAVYARGSLFLNRRLLRAANRDLVIATALAYEMLRGPGTAASGRPTPPDRPRPCDAIGDLLQRYPGSREWFAGRECAPA